MTCGSGEARGHFDFSVSLSSSLVTYTTLAALSAGTAVTVTATSQADAAKSISATITITPTIPISVTFYVPPTARMQVNSSTLIRAAIANDVSGDPEVQWSTHLLRQPVWLVRSDCHVQRGRIHLHRTTRRPSRQTVAVTATSMTDPTKSVSASIVITTAASTLANGTTSSGSPDTPVQQRALSSASLSGTKAPLRAASRT